jgi:hypothetical protein
MDSNDIGSADDDCDVIGDNLTISWNRSGTHKLVYHVTDNDGAHTSEVLTVEVLNTPPLIRTANVACVAYEPCTLDAQSTIDALNDLEGLTIVWDVDIEFDSNEDGILDNDADIIGKTVTYTFRKAGIQSIKVMAWDEDPQRPGTKVITFAVAPADRTALENIGASLAGEDANPMMQGGLLVLLLGLLLMFSRRKSKSGEEEMWGDVSQSLMVENNESREDALAEKRPNSPPPEYLFQVALENAPKTIGVHASPPADGNGPPLPETGLPEGWTAEQWSYYGQQWLESQNP